MSPEELAAIIEKTGGALEDMKMEEEDEDEAEDDDEEDEKENEDSSKKKKNAEQSESPEDEDINKKFDLDNYDEEGMNFLTRYLCLNKHSYRVFQFSVCMQPFHVKNVFCRDWWRRREHWRPGSFRQPA